MYQNLYSHTVNLPTCHLNCRIGISLVPTSHRCHSNFPKVFLLNVALPQNCILKPLIYTYQLLFFNYHTSNFFRSQALLFSSSSSITVFDAKLFVLTTDFHRFLSSSFIAAHQYLAIAKPRSFAPLSM